MNKLTIYVSLALLACLVISCTAHPSKGSKEGERKKKREFIHSTCRVVNGTETVFEDACTDPNLACSPMMRRGPPPKDRTKRHAIFKELDISICMCKNCSSDADCFDGVTCNTTCGMCEVGKERMAYASACERDGVQVRTCPSYKHCATMCAKNVTFQGQQYLLAQCHLNKEGSSSSSSSSSSGGSDTSSSSSEEGSDSHSSQDEDDAAEEEEEEYEDVDVANQVLEDAERELLSLLQD